MIGQSTLCCSHRLAPLPLELQRPMGQNSVPLALRAWLNLVGGENHLTSRVHLRPAYTPEDGNVLLRRRERPELAWLHGEHGKGNGFEPHVIFRRDRSLETVERHTWNTQLTSQKFLPKPSYEMLVYWHSINQASLLNLEVNWSLLDEDN